MPSRFVRATRAKPVSNSIDRALERLNEEFDTDDLRVVRLRGRTGVTFIAAVYIESLVDHKRLMGEVIEPLERGGPPMSDVGPNTEDRRRRLAHAVRTTNQETVRKHILRGYAALFTRGRYDTYLVAVEAERAREVNEPSTEVQILGPKEAFTEEVTTNVNLIRRRLPTPQLQVKKYTLGRLSKTEVLMIYLDGIIDPSLPAKVSEGLSRVDVDFIRELNDVNELLFGRSLTPFPLVQRTERPDRVVTALTDGRLAILVNGTPFISLMPTTFAELQRDGETAFGGATTTVFVRWLRYLGLFVTIVAPALYAGLLGVDLHILPPELLLTVAATRQGVPYPILYEILVFLIVIDVVQEASAQAPRSFGQTLTIAGSLIIGQAAVQAQLASQLLVIVLAVSSIGSLLAANIPLGYAVRLFKYPVTVLAGVLGFYGLSLGLVGITIHLASLKSAGVPYLTPFGPSIPRDLRYYSLFWASKGNRLWRPEAYRPLDEQRSAPEGKRRR